MKKKASFLSLCKCKMCDETTWFLLSSFTVTTALFKLHTSSAHTTPPSHEDNDETRYPPIFYVMDVVVDVLRMIIGPNPSNDVFIDSDGHDPCVLRYKLPQLSSPFVIPKDKFMLTAAPRPYFCHSWCSRAKAFGIQRNDTLTPVSITCVGLTSTRTLRESLRRLTFHAGLQLCGRVPYLTQVLDVYTYANDLYLVTPQVHTTLDTTLKSKQLLTKDHIDYFMYQAFYGLAGLHARNLVHRNLNPWSISLSQSCDLFLDGFQQCVGLECRKQEAPQELNNIEGIEVMKIWHQSPETLLSYDSKLGSYTQDVWSLGCIWMECILRKPFLPGKDMMSQTDLIMKCFADPIKSIEECPHMADRLKQNITRLVQKGETYPRNPHPLWEQLLEPCEPYNSDPALFDLFRKIFVLDMDKRISARDVLEHEYFREFRTCMEDGPLPPPSGSLRELATFRYPPEDAFDHVTSENYEEYLQPLCVPFQQQ
eukprot:PhF_6_TR27152/c0_g1_i3/m.39674